MKTCTCILLAAIMLLPQLTRADEGQGSPSIESFQQLDLLRSQNALLAEKVKNKELRSKLDQNDAKNPPSQQNGQPPVSPSAHVQMVSGIGNTLTALIILPGGGQMAAKVGTTIPGIGQVRSIASNEVTVASRQQTISLPFAGDSSSMHPLMPGVR